MNRGLSFPAISASGSNAAVIHYQPQESTVKGINTEDIYLRECYFIFATVLSEGQLPIEITNL